MFTMKYVAFAVPTFFALCISFEPMTPTSPGPSRYGLPLIVSYIVPSRISIISSRRC